MTEESGQPTGVALRLKTHLSLSWAAVMAGWLWAGILRVEWSLLVQLLGAGAVLVGIWWVWPPASLVLAGAATILYMEGRRR